MGEIKKIKSALISVYHKDKLDKIVKTLNDLGVKIYSTGGTQRFIETLGVPAIAVESLTDYPSIFGGRVKTLHPKVFGGILYRRDVPGDCEQAVRYGIPDIDLVIVDLYPFEETVDSGAPDDDIIEKIDIGGISLIRAAAKNFKDVLIVPSQAYYDDLQQLLDEKDGESDINDRREFARGAFEVTSEYDTAISDYFLFGDNNESEVNSGGEELDEFDDFDFDDDDDLDEYDDDFDDDLYDDNDFEDDDDDENENFSSRQLRYGENPHQTGSFLGNFDDLFVQLHGKDLSYNNLLDMDAAVNLMADFKEPAFAILKHNNACGLAIDPNPLQAWKKALAGDPVSAFGGVIITNREVDEATAGEIDKLFYEVLIAPSFTDEALELLQGKKNRILLAQIGHPNADLLVRSALGGVLLEDKDMSVQTPADMKNVTKKKPTAEELDDLVFANIAVKHSKSNAIVLAHGKQLLASGTGQTSRVDALKQAIEKARAFGFDLKGAVMASDAYFPFPDCVEIAAEAGITAIVQPGGSIKDKDSIDAADRLGVAMVFTGVRHFKH